MESGHDMEDRRSARLGALIRHRIWILTGTGLCMLAAFVISHILPKIYRATTYVLLSESKMGQGSPYPAWEYSSLGTYLTLVSSDASSLKAIEHFHLNEPPYRLNVRRFRSSIFDAQVLKATRLIQIDVDFPDPRMAADLANYLAQSAVELNQRMNTTDTETTQRFLEERLDQATARLSAAEAKSLEVRKRARLEEKEEELDVLFQEKENVAKKCESLRLELTQHEGTAKSLEQALRSEPPTVQLKKSATSDRFLERSVEKLGANKGADISSTEEVLNSTYQDLRLRLLESTAETAGQRQALQEATARLAELDKQIDTLVAQVTEFHAQTNRADDDLKLARDGYESVGRDYRNASLVVTGKSQDIKQVAPALVPELPVRPRTLLNTLLAGLIGLVLLAGLALVTERFREWQVDAGRFSAEEVTLDARRT
jgi:uncharacterized protein involved in exopolysaccharide biosynthesis